MKERLTLSNPSEILYITQLVERDIAQIEQTLKQRQEFLRKFKERDEKK